MRFFVLNSMGCEPATAPIAGEGSAFFTPWRGRAQNKEGGCGMPSKPKRPCRHPGCPNLSDQPYCEAHRKQALTEQRAKSDAQRGSSYERGYTRAWAKAREGFLARHPLCVHCLASGKVTPATRVDHIVAHKGDSRLFWDKSNWQPLCESCHNRKTAKYDHQSWNSR